MRLTALWLMPVRRGIDYMLQCVASSKASATTRSTSAPLILIGPPRQHRLGFIEQPVKAPQ